MKKTTLTPLKLAAMIQTTLKNIAECLIARQQMLAVAESCTGGWLAKVCTDLPGSSVWFERGLVTYSNQAKTELLKVPVTTLNEFGAVSEQTVSAMVVGLLNDCPADWGIAISGVAGPDGGTKINPVGSVWFAWMQKEQSVIAFKQQFSGDRDAVRKQAVEFALQELNKLLK